MTSKHAGSLESLHVPELGVGRSESEMAALALASTAATEPPSTPKDALKQRLLGSLKRSATGRFGLYVDRLARLFDVSLESAEALVAKVEAGASWQPGPADGIEMISVRPGPRYDGTGAIAGIGRLRPGARFPRHAHLGDETTLVLAGGFRDSSGIEVERGDELFESAGTEHDFVVLEGEDCIAAVVAVGGIELR